MGHAVDHLDALGQLVLEGPLEVDVLHEGTDADLLVVEELVSVLFRDGQAVLGQVQAELIHVLPRDVDRAAAVAELVGDLLGGDLLCDLGGLRRRQILVQHPHVRLAGPVGQDGADEYGGQPDRGQQRALHQADSLPDHQ